MIKKMIEQVSLFHKSFGIDPFKGTPTKEQIKLRYDLFKEEFDEYLDSESLVDKADAIVDMLYILAGTFHLLSSSEELEFDYNENNADTNEFALKMISLQLKRIFILAEQNNIISIKGYLRDIYLYVLDLAFNNDILNILPELFDEVHSSNMSKLDDNGKPIINGENGVFDETRPKGKVLKSANFREPDLKSILEKYGRLT